jgi:multidrug efflux pump subunit AcrA (membrane-fusion protein)
VWASLASVSSAAIAPALVTVEYSRKAVQHHDGGPVAAVLVKEGEFVQKGQTLVRIDLGDVKGEVESLSTAATPGPADTAASRGRRLRRVGISRGGRRTRP